MGITLGKKQLNKGRVSLYLNYSYNGKRRKEYLLSLIHIWQRRSSPSTNRDWKNSRIWSAAYPKN